MTIWSDTWFPASADWFNRAGKTLGKTVFAVIDHGMEVVGLIVAVLILIALLPILAHFATALMLMILGAPIWLILMFFCGF